MGRRFFPFLQWIDQLRDTRVLHSDLVAGIIVALVLIPQSMAYAQLAGLSPIYGLYAAILPAIVATLWGSSHQLSTGPVAIVSLLTAAALMPLAAVGSEEYVALAILLAFLVGLIQLGFGLLRLGVVVNYLSSSIILGFTNAAAIIIGLSQLNKLFGVSLERSEHFILAVWGILQQVDEFHTPTLLMGLSGVLIIWMFKKYLPKFPGVLIAVMVTTILSWMLEFEQSGGRVVGQIPLGLPVFSLPELELDAILKLLVDALVISFIGFTEAIFIAKAISTKTKIPLDPNQELIGQGLANISASFTQAYPVSGSFSRSSINFNSGAKTGLSSIIASLVVFVSVLFFTPLFYYLPQSVLAAVIIMAIFRLINFKAIMHIWQTCRDEGITAWVTFIVTLIFAPHLYYGIFVGVCFALGFYLYRKLLG